MCDVISDKHPTFSNLSERSYAYNIQNVDNLVAGVKI